MHVLRQLVGYIGISGSKLDGATQRTLISMTAVPNGHEILCTYTEGSASSSVGWPELEKAIDHARQTGAFLVVVRPGRLTHLRVRFWAKLAEANVPIVLHRRLTPPDEIRAMADAARAECAWIGYLTRDAMFCVKQSGVKFGTPRNLTPEARLKGARRSSINRSLRAMQETIASAKIALDMRSRGSTLQAIADELNCQGHKTRRGRRWNRVQVKRVLDRLRKNKRILSRSPN